MIRVAPGPALALLPLDRHELAACLDTMLHRAVPDACDPNRSLDLDLACLRDADIARLNADYLGCTGPTNILAWPPNPADMARLPGGAEPKHASAMIALSVDSMRREARLYAQDPATYCRRLLAHALAHGLGYDHGPAMDALCARMLESAN